MEIKIKSATIIKQRFRQKLVTVAATSLFVIAGSLTQSAVAQESVRLKQVSIFGGGFHKGYFSPDGTKMSLVGGRTSNLKVVETTTGRVICKHNISSNPFIVAAPFAPDGKTIGVAYSLFDSTNKTSTLKIKLLDASNCQETRSLVDLKANRGNYLSFTSDGQLLAAVADIPRIWGMKTGREVFQMTMPEGFLTQAALLSANGRWLAAYAEKFQAPNTFGKFIVTNFQTNQQRDLTDEIIKAFRFSADSSLLVTVNAVFGKSGWVESTRVKVYDTYDWAIKQQFDVPDKWNDVFDVSSDNRLIAIGGFGKFRIYSLETGKLLAEEYHYKRTRKADLAGAPDLISFINHIEFSPDGKWLSTGGDIGYVKLWKVSVDK